MCFFGAIDNLLLMQAEMVCREKTILHLCYWLLVMLRIRHVMDVGLEYQKGAAVDAFGYRLKKMNSHENK